MGSVVQAKRTRYFILAVILLPVVVFWQTRSFDFVWDDEVNVETNRYLNPVTAANMIRFWQEPYERLYIPVTYTIWALIARLADGRGAGTLDPALFHLANLLFHVLGAVLVFVILKMLLRHQGAACGGALLFALHPVQVEPVAWVTGMKDVLSGLLSLVAIWQYLLYSNRKISAVPPAGGKSKKFDIEKKFLDIQRNSRLHFGAATAAFVLALLAKPTAVVTPLMALILDHWALGRPLRECARSLSVWLILILPLAVVTRLLQPESDLEFVTPLWARPLVAGDALTFYLTTLFWPLNLAPDYGRLPELVIEKKWLYVNWAAPCALAALVYLGRRRRPWLVSALGIFVVGLLPVLGLVPFSFQNTSTVADRYLYLSMFGPALALAGVLGEVHRPTLAVVSGAVLAVLAGLSMFQTRHWQDNATLFDYALNHNPGSWTAHYSLGRVFAKQGKNNEAIGYFRDAARLKPEFTNAHFSLGSLLAHKGDYQEAIAEYRKALEMDPNFVDARFGLGNALALRGELDAAGEEFSRALKINPGRVDINFTFGNLLVKQGRLAEAAERYGRTLELSPDFAPAHNSLGRVLAAQGVLNRAMDHFQQAVRLDPTFAEAHESLALGLAQQGKTAEAARHLREAQRLRASRLR